MFGVQDASDPALLAVRRVRARFPHCDVTVVVKTASHGPNRKVCNLINMLPEARHDILVFSDSDLHVAPDYLDRLVAELEDCLGTTMALRRDTLTRTGGLQVLTRHLADDNVLGRLVLELGLRIGLANTVPATAVPETSMSTLWQHELRWARTIRALEPVGFAASTLQFPLFWAALVCVLSAGAFWAVGLLAAAWVARAAAALCVDRALRFERRSAVRIWLLPLRDLLSVVEIAASFLGGRVVWRGHIMRADHGRGRATAGTPASGGIAASMRSAASTGD